MDRHGLKLEKKIRLTCKNQQKISMVKAHVNCVMFSIFRRKALSRVPVSPGSPNEIFKSWEEAVQEVYAKKNRVAPS